MAEFQHVEGLRELQYALNQLGPKIARNVLSRSVAEGARLIRDEAKIRAPVSTGPVSDGHPPPGTLKRSIVIKRAFSDATQAIYVVAVRHGKDSRAVGKKKRNMDAYYWRFVEFGHRIGNAATGTLARLASRHRGARRGGAAIGFVQAQPFMRPAWESKKEAALDQIKADLAQGVEDEARKLGGP